MFLWFSACHCEKQRMLRRGNQGEAVFRYAGFPRSLRSLRNDKRVGTPAPDVIAFFLLSFRATPRNLGVSRISLRRILHCVQNDNMGGAPAPDVIAFFLLSFRAMPRNLGVSRISLRRILHCVQNDNMGWDTHTRRNCILPFVIPSNAEESRRKPHFATLDFNNYADA